ncbi:Uncharacterized protein dnm_023170 [Desulfonema magnum]|uniref:Uncharacterized protein n=1 Tax=Desulfonema magnum TaxID=45655 RepID=A0A975BIW7_9BACT|nr:Uncharacterized protein dnm_023170 [Desulfonema magnum]
MDSCFRRNDRKKLEHRVYEIPVAGGRLALPNTSEILNTSVSKSDFY